MSQLSILEKLIEDHDRNPFAFVGELNAVACELLPALVRLARAARTYVQNPDEVGLREMAAALDMLEGKPRPVAERARDSRSESRPSLVVARNLLG